MHIDDSFYPDNQKRLDKILQERYSQTRNQVQHWIENGWVLVSDKLKLKSYIPYNSEKIRVEIPDRAPDLPIPKKILPIIYEDDDIVVINKPSGIAVHPGAGDSSDTVVGRLIYMNIELTPIGLPVRPGVVQRLDKETSGVMLLSKTIDSYYKLRDMISAHQFERCYLGIVENIPKDVSGTVKGYEIRDPANRIRFKMIENKTASSKIAITHYRVIERFSTASIVRFQLETGRTHQIRVAARHLGFPIISDKLYGKRSKLIERQALHSAYLKFINPMSGKSMKFCACLPQDMMMVLKQLRRKL